MSHALSHPPEDWNRVTQQTVLATGFQIREIRQISGGLHPVLLLHALRSTTLPTGES